MIFNIFMVLLFLGSSYGQNYLRPCYFCNYQSAGANYTPEHYIPNLCTHIFYAFGAFNLTTFEAISPNPTYDLPISNSLNFYERVNNLKTIQPGLKTSLSFGGWGFSTEDSLPFSQLVNDTKNIQVFVDSAIKYVRKYGFDGIDIDWEFPTFGGPWERDDLITFLQILYDSAINESKTTGKDRLMITAAVAQGLGNIRDGYNISAMVSYVDYISIMSYDYYSGENFTQFNSPLFNRKANWPNETDENINGSASAWTNGGMPKNKTLIGFPTYGHSWLLWNKTNNVPNAPGTPWSSDNTAPRSSYDEYCKLLAQNGTTRIFDDEAKVPYMYFTDKNNITVWISYDDLESYKYKLDWLKKEGYAGAFIWALDTDDYAGVCNSSNKYPLMGFVTQELAGIKINQTFVFPTPATTPKGAERTYMDKFLICLITILAVLFRF